MSPTFPSGTEPLLPRHVASIGRSPLADFSDLTPWDLVAHAAPMVKALLANLPAADYRISDDVAVHRSATVEEGAVLKGPLILGAGCFVAAGAYLRGGNWVAEGCTLGPGAELKSSFLFAGTRLSHFNFVGDSVLGAGVNLEAGSIVCNCRNERPDRELRVWVGGRRLSLGDRKFGALLGDGCRIGANAVIAPGAMLPPGGLLARGAVLDQDGEPVDLPPGSG